MWFGAGFTIKFRTVEEAAKIKPEIEQFLTERMPNVWAGKTFRRKENIKVDWIEDKEVVEGADDVRAYMPPGRQQVYSEMFYDLYHFIIKKYPGSVVRAVAEYDVYGSYSKQVLEPNKSQPIIDYDEVFALEEVYGGDIDAIADELGISPDEVLQILQ